MALPRSIWVRNAHLEQASIAINILALKSGQWLIIEWIRTGAGSNRFGGVRQKELGAIRVHPWNNVKRLRANCPRDVLINTIERGELIQQIGERSCWADFRCMDVGIAPHRWLIGSIASGFVSDGSAPNVTALVGLAD